MGLIVGDDAGGGKEERILVSVRLRPLNAKEIERNDPSEWECINGNTVIFKNSLPPTAYTFDRVFGCDSTTKQVYDEGAKEVALSVVNGINSSIFAYGQTSSGKTYTMTGITEYSVSEIYDHIEKHQEREFVLKFSAMEIYNEAVKDLLNPDSGPLRLLDDPEKGTTVDKLTEETLRDRDHLRELLSFCEAQRQIGETTLNEMSSRSHQILRLSIESSAREFCGRNNFGTLSASVNFVDLAGSERASQALTAGSRLKEGCHINRSLLTLGTVIRKLSKGRNGHVPFRDSKLTRILQSSIGGNARTAIICTMSPARTHIEQSRNTLQFASCAKQVVTSAHVNVVISDKAMVKHLRRQLARMEDELRFIGSPSVASPDELLREKEDRIQKMEREMKELMQQRDLAQSRLEDLLRCVGDDQDSRQWDEFSQASIPHAYNLYDDTQSVSDASYSTNQSPESSFMRHGASIKHHLQLSISNSPPFMRKRSSQSTSLGSVDLCKEVQCIETMEPSLNTVEDFNLLLTEDIDSLLPLTEDAQPPTKMETKLMHKSETLPHIRETLTKKETDLMYESRTLSSARDYGSSKRLILVRSRSCRATLMSSDSSPWFEEVEVNDHTPPKSFLKDHPGLPRVKRISSISCDNNEHESCSRDGSDNSEGTALDDAVKPQNVKISPTESMRRVSDSIDDLKELVLDDASKPQNGKISLTESMGRVFNSIDDLKELALDDAPKPQNDKISPTGSMRRVSHSANGLKELALDDALKPQNGKISPTGSMRRVSNSVDCLKKYTEAQHQNELDDDQDSGIKITIKDVCIQPVLKSSESPSRWQLEFEKKQREIVELWHACNVSLIHRSYFFILINGDRNDSIYMEVEHRRLSFLRNSISQECIVKTENSNHELSVKNIRREREKLARLMKRLPTAERESLYKIWGIALDSKQRRIQLSRRLWNKTDDMEHVRESAMIVGKLLGFLEPGSVPKEMFGLCFTPHLTPRRSSFRC